MTRRFHKYEGLGNDFLVFDALDTEPFDADLARALCDRHRGVGADGVLTVGRGSDGGPFMRVVNADGSRPEMCGNGIRCAVVHLARTGLVEGETVSIDTDAGPHACTLRSLDDDRRGGVVEVSMRPYALAPEGAWLRADAPQVDATFAVGDRSVRGTAVSMGNPHLVIFDAASQDAASLAVALERHPSFPQRVNVGLAELTGPRAIALRVLERGVGYTEACGTGACAAVVAAVETGRAPRGEPVDVSLPGGVLRIVVGALGAPVRMTGPARFVFYGNA